MLKKTPLFEAHERLGAKMTDFGGWEMPLQYTSIIDEHMAARERAALFDVSHMGEIVVTGVSAKETLNRLLTNDMERLRPKKAAYSLITNENGGVVDDLLVYMLGGEEFLLVVNASNTEKDFKWLKERAAELSGETVVSDCSDEYGQIAVQGPCAHKILQRLTDTDLGGMGYFSFEIAGVCGAESIISRTGYTGEDGFEIYCPRSWTVQIWESLLKHGESDGVKPAGLGARDTLRFESALPLYGHELSEEITPVEAGLKAFVNLEKGDFIGRETLARQVENGVTRTLVGIELTDRGIPRSGYRIEIDGSDAGYVTSGAYSPIFKKGLAMALISVDVVHPGAEVRVVIRDKSAAANIVRLPFYKREKI